jgi:hypothetical protein
MSMTQEAEVERVATPQPWGQPGGNLFNLWLDSYKYSCLVQRTAETNEWSVLDLDGSLAAGSFKARRLVRQILEKRGALIYSTARTVELVLSSMAYNLSHYAGGIERPAPQWRWNKKREIFEFVHLHTLKEFQDVLDPPDAIFAFGDNIYLRQLNWCTEHAMGPYVADLPYEHTYLDPLYYSGAEKLRWRERLEVVLKKIGAEQYLAAIEDPSAHKKKKANVLRLPYRAQLDFWGRDAISDKYRVLGELKDALQGTSLAGQAEGVDESRPNDKDPDKHKATLYIMPPPARKEDMINRGLIQTCNKLRIPTKRVKIRIWGDTLTDFAGMCEAAYDSEVDGLLIGDRLAKCIVEQANFAAVDMQRFHIALKPTKQEGVYTYENPHQHGGIKEGGPVRTITVGSLAYPGTDGADTMLAHIKKHKLDMVH